MLLRDKVGSIYGHDNDQGPKLSPLKAQGSYTAVNPELLLFVP